MLSLKLYLSLHASSLLAHGSGCHIFSEYLIHIYLLTHASKGDPNFSASKHVCVNIYAVFTRIANVA